MKKWWVSQDIQECLCSKINVIFRYKTLNLSSGRIYRPSFRENKPKNLSFSVIENERFGLVFAITGYINSGKGHIWPLKEKNGHINVLYVNVIYAEQGRPERDSIWAMMVARILSKFLLSFKVVGETKRILDTFRVSTGNRARICKRLRSPGIDFKESIPPAYETWRASTSNEVVVPAPQAGNRFLGSL